ncbi:SIMPL domain-containing protein [Cognatishimia sp. F0-27]|uniref:SIMPL domain-containing protein n=1 Tax=Cognatishimia sp. F0-27 TaxID=2816855 RepID=UPI001D0C53A0|nr:SIMPL domain-containing protein [Cognatishimia sp. F0-27]MCC1491562.1 SIMPL domain-containing protein [Cognatishimia sp. F0-27]
MATSAMLQINRQSRCHGVFARLRETARMAQAQVSRAALATGLALALLSDPVHAETAAAGTISVRGEARVSASPDMATITLGAVHVDKDAVAAMDATSAALRSIIAQLEALGVAGRDMQTANLMLTERERFDQDRGAPVSIGFEARNTLTVRLRDLDLVGRVLADVLDQGANRLQGLHFGLQDPSPLENKARRLAVADALARAKLYADAADVPLGPVVQISDIPASGEPQPRMAERAFIADAASSVPIEAGEIEAYAAVTVVFAIADPR